MTVYISVVVVSFLLFNELRNSDARYVSASARSSRTYLSNRRINYHGVTVCNVHILVSLVILYGIFPYNSVILYTFIDVAFIFIRLPVMYFFATLCQLMSRFIPAFTSSRFSNQLCQRPVPASSANLFAFVVDLWLSASCQPVAYHIYHLHYLWVSPVDTR